MVLSKHLLVVVLDNQPSLQKQKKPTNKFMDAVIKIKQVPDAFAVSTGLDKYHRSRMPQCSDYLQVAQGPDGRYITGLDEDAWEILNIEDDVLREEKRQEIFSLRTKIEKLVRKDISATSDFWETFGVELGTDEDLVLNTANPMHVIKWKALVANGYVAPDFESSGMPQYRQAKYYCFTDAKFEKEKVSTQKLRDKARAALSNMADNNEKMILIGQFLEGFKYKKGMKPDTLYSMLSDYIDTKNAPENVSEFLRATSKSVDELQYKVTVTKAIKSKVIRFKEGQYFRGGVNLGKNIPEVLENLKSPEFSNEFMQIHEEVA